MVSALDSGHSGQLCVVSCDTIAGRWGSNLFWSCIIYDCFLLKKPVAALKIHWSLINADLLEHLTWPQLTGNIIKTHFVQNLGCSLSMETSVINQVLVTKLIFIKVSISGSDKLKEAVVDCFVAPETDWQSCLGSLYVLLWEYFLYEQENTDNNIEEYGSDSCIVFYQLDSKFIWGMLVSCSEWNFSPNPRLPNINIDKATESTLNEEPTSVSILFCMFWSSNLNVSLQLTTFLT